MPGTVPASSQNNPISARIHRRGNPQLRELKVQAQGHTAIAIILNTVSPYSVPGSYPHI